MSVKDIDATSLWSSASSTGDTFQQQQQFTLSDEYVDEKLRTQFAPFDSHSIRYSLQISSRQSESFVFLSSINPNAPREEIGKQLCHDLQEIQSTLGDMFSMVLDNNFDIESARVRSAERLTAANKIYQTNRIVSQMNGGLPPTEKQLERNIALELNNLRIDFESKHPKNQRPTRDELTIHERNLEDCRLRLYAEHRDAENGYNTAHQEIIASARALPDMLAAVEIEKVLDQVLLSMKVAQSNLVAKLKEALNKGKHEDIKVELKGMATVGFTSSGKAIQVSDPYTNNHLRGISAILTKNYHASTFQSFIKSVVQMFNFALSEEVSNNSPMEGLAELVKMIAEWQNRDLWAMMTPDLFFSCILLKSISPKSPLRKDALKEAMEFAAKLAKDPSLGDSTLPLFNHLLQHINILQENSKFDSFTDAKPAATSAKSTSHTRAATTWPRKAEFEQAAAASTTVGAADQLYMTEVTRAMKKSQGNFGNGAPIPYLAVKQKSSICPKCYPDPNGKGPAPAPCDRPCFDRVCAKCNLFGHTAKLCAQHPSTFNK